MRCHSLEDKWHEWHSPLKARSSHAQGVKTSGTDEWHRPRDPARFDGLPDSAVPFLPKTSGTHRPASTG